MFIKQLQVGNMAVFAYLVGDTVTGDALVIDPADNAKEIIQTINRLKPSSAKGTYIRSIYLSTTMSPGIQIDTKSAV